MFQSNSIAEQRALLPHFQVSGLLPQSSPQNSAPKRAARLLLLSAGLALACGGRGADSLLLPSQPASSSPSPTMAPELAAAAQGSGSSGACSQAAADYIIADSPDACSTRELPECAEGSQRFVDTCGCGCSSVPAFPRACRTDCARTGFCEASRFEDFPDFSGTLSDWWEDLQSDLEFAEGGWLIEGVCAGDRRFVERSNHFFWQAHVFSSAGAFLALGTQGDSIDETCGGGSYFPEPVRCTGATITKVWMQDSLSHLKVGDPIKLPSAI